MMPQKQTRMKATMKRNKRQLNERFRRHQLEHMVDPVILVDFFKPKSGTPEEVVVVTFNVIDEAAARDFAMFIEMSPYDTIDTEFTELSDTNNMWKVHVEYRRDRDFWKNFDEMIADIENMTDKMKWSLRFYMTGEVKRYRAGCPHADLPLDPKKYMTHKKYLANKGQDAIAKFLAKAASRTDAQKSTFSLEGSSYRVVDEGDFKGFHSQVSPFASGTDIVFLERSLGASYSVFGTSDSHILVVNDDNHCLKVTRNG